MHAESGIIPRFLIWPKGLEFANRCGINLLPNPGPMCYCTVQIMLTSSSSSSCTFSLSFL